MAQLSEEALTDALACYSGMPGHVWDRVTSIDKSSRTKYGWRILYRCMSCGSEREDVVDIHGVLQHRKYKHSQAFTEIKRPEASATYTRREVMRARYVRLQSKNGLQLVNEKLA